MNESINCLRCRHAQMLPHTDFSNVLQIREGKVEINRDVIVPIGCGKTNRNRPAHLFETCDIADPQIQFPKSGKRGGDKTRKIGTVAGAFLRAVYPRWPKAQWDELCAVMGRGADAIQVCANKRGAIRETTADEMALRMERSKATKEARGSRVNVAQSDYILTRHRSGEWPLQGGCNKGAFYARRQELQREILAAVAALGEPKSWRQITQHIYSMSPAARRKDRAKRPRKILQI